MTRHVLAAALVLANCSMGTTAERKLRDISWQELRERGALPAGVEIRSDGTLKVVSAKPEGLTVTVVQIDSPGISKPRYVVRGRVAYRDVAKAGYLEMWNVFPDGQYFSRTLGESGPMGKISGSSSERDFMLPFDASGAKSKPTKLVINVVLPSTGEVTLSGLTLLEMD